MRIVENSIYEHERYGQVRVVDVSNGVVSMQKRNKATQVAGQRFPAGKTQSAAGFRDEAEPADVKIDAKAAVFDLMGVDQE